MKRYSRYIMIILGCLLGFGPGGQVIAAQVDPAPMPDEVVQRVLDNLKQWKANPVPRALKQHLNDALSLIEEDEQLGNVSQHLGSLLAFGVIA